jgi:hypothetical protein
MSDFTVPPSSLSCSCCEATANGEKSALLDSGWQETAMDMYGAGSFVLCPDCVKTIYGSFPPLGDFPESPPPIPNTVKDEITKPIKIVRKKTLT